MWLRIDCSLIRAAQNFAPLKHRYKTGSRFDLVASLEVIEHVDDHLGFVSALAGLTRPGGMLTLSTINRTPKVRENGIPLSISLKNIGLLALAGS